MQEEFKCPHCDGCFEEKTSSEIFLDKYIETKTKKLKCKNCGYTLVPINEVERIYQKIRKHEKSPSYIKFLEKVKSEVKMPLSGLEVL